MAGLLGGLVGVAYGASAGACAIYGQAIVHCNRNWCDAISRLREKSGEFVNSRAPAPGVRRRPRKIRINAQENRDMQGKTKRRRRRQTFTAPANDPRTCLGRLPAPQSPL